jgi:hypothetical protein
VQIIQELKLDKKPKQLHFITDMLHWTDMDTWLPSKHLAF